MFIEFSITPPFERPHQAGVQVSLDIVERSSIGEGRLWARPWSGMSWMEEGSTIDVRAGDPIDLDSDVAKSLLDNIKRLRLPIAFPDRYGIHPTTYRLKICTGFNCCEFSWVDELPSDWAALGDVVKTLESLGFAHAREA